jgi:signal transduction histidine kinase
MSASVYRGGNRGDAWDAGGFSYRVRLTARSLLPWLLTLFAAAAWAQPAIHIKAASLRGPDGTAADVNLPDSWNARKRSGTWEYEVAFDSEVAPSESWGLYVPRAGNRLAVHLNGRRIGQLGHFDGDLSDHAQHPHFFFLPADTMKPGRNVLRFVVQGERARYAGLSSMVVGPAAAVRPLYVWREVAQVWGSFAIISVSLVFGLIAGALAFSVRDRSFAIFAAACLFCAVRTSYAVVTDPPMDYRLWAALVDACYAGYLACLCLFCVEVLELHRRWITAATTTLIAATLVLAPLHAAWRLAGARQVLLALMVIYAATLCLTVIIEWYRSRSPASRVLAAAGAASVGMAIHDHILVFYTSDGYASFALARYSLLIFIVAMGWLLVDRYARQAKQESRLRVEVAHELQMKKEELEAQFDRQQQLAAENAQQRERRRILQDLHDGMGLQLNGLLGMLQNGPLQRDNLSREVRTTIEQMRMLMDSTEAFDGDVSILLGHIRYRIEQRLARQGIRLEWEAALAQPQRVLPPQRAIALQRMMFELATNTLKHSGATAVSFCARDGAQADAALSIVYADNGQGFIPDGAKAGIGTRSIDRRVSDLDGQLTVNTGQARGVRYELEIPASSFDAEPVAVRSTTLRGAAELPNSG